MTLGPFLTLILSLRKRQFEDEVPRRMDHQASRQAKGDVSQKASADATLVPGAVIGSPEDAARARSSQPVWLNLGPTLSLLMMLRRRRPPCQRRPWHEWNLPYGCIFAARYSSR
jgi:hypothetical protein